MKRVSQALIALLFLDVALVAVGTLCWPLGRDQGIFSWVGDVIATLSHDDTTTSALIIDRPGVPDASACGCQGDDVDVILSDANGTSSVENECADPAVPAIAGILTPSPDALAAFDGEDGNGAWTMTITDGAPTFDDGVFDAWCLDFNAGGGDDDTGVPATNTWGVIILVALFLGASLLFLRRRGDVSA